MSCSLLTMSNSTDDIPMVLAPLVNWHEPRIDRESFWPSRLLLSRLDPNKWSQMLIFLQQSLSKNRTRRQTVFHWQISWTIFTSTEQQAAWRSSPNSFNMKRTDHGWEHSQDHGITWSTRTITVPKFSSILASSQMVILFLLPISRSNIRRQRDQLSLWRHSFG